MFVKNIFWNSEEFRIRAGWRILIQMILMASLTIGFTFVDQQFLEYLPLSPITLKVSFFQPVEAFLAVYLSMIICGKYLDKRPFNEFGFKINKSWYLDLFAGLLLGAVLMTLIFTVEYFAGWITITDKVEHVGTETGFSYGIIYGVILFLCVGFYEEMLTRGYLLKNMSEGFNFKNNPRNGIIIAVLVSSLIFGFAHAVNPNATLVSSISICFAGILLALGFVITGRLAIPIGLHITWNFFQGYVFGFPVSGNQPTVSFINIQQNGPEVITGGAFGPEAGIIGIIFYFVGAGIMILWIKVREKKINLILDIAEYKKPPLKEIEKITV